MYDDQSQRPRKFRCGLVLMLHEGEDQRLIDLIAEQLPQVFIVYRRLDARPLWITDEPPRGVKP